ncbi:MAG TPA: GNAT family N-acetyltransferase [Chloroflexota bacterium]|nr:GNAT family N-acetyltransferase [Chloroflexota bacterium]
MRLRLRQGSEHVRPATQLDVVSMQRLSTDEESLILAPSPLDEAPGLVWSTVVPGRQRSWIAEDGSGLLGFAQARPRGYVLGWELVRVHARPDADAQRVLAALVQQVLAHLQERGIPRLFARTIPESRGAAAVASCGFSLLTSECFFVREPSKVLPPEEMPTGMRYRMPQDAWPLRQLENSQTPPLVSQLEGLTSLNWSMPPQRRWHRAEPSELVVEREGQIVGWVGWVFRGLPMGDHEVVRLGLLTGTDDADMATSLIQYALHLIGSRHPHARVAVRLRDYQMPLHLSLLDLGFVEAARVSLHIKHGRLQLLPKKASRLLEFAPTVRAFSFEP